jgi:hypothetical protein
MVGHRQAGEDLGHGADDADTGQVKRYPTTPLALKLAAAAVLVLVLGWWTLDRVDRAGNERRLSAIASEIAGRAVKVHCPGPLGRAFGKDSVVEGFVRFDADGRPADETRLQAGSCAELDALAEGRRGKELACTERAGILCGRHGRELATAVDVVTHESFHLQGIQDEAKTECSSLQTMAQTARALGATPAQATALAHGQYAEGYPRMPDQYRSPACADGEAFDLRPDDPSFP